MADRPAWMDWSEPEVAYLADDELVAFAEDWKQQGDGYRLRRQAVSRDHPDAFRLGFSGWWCSKRESMARREIARRESAGRGATIDSYETGEES